MWSSFLYIIGLAVKAIVQLDKNKLCSISPTQYGQSNQKISSLYQEADSNFLKIVLYQ